eukprot:m.180421 g.180421  ORF g.180421 m.180421 type:complete len:265 (+) comp15499_c1_seq3:188-982(+)
MNFDNRFEIACVSTLFSGFMAKLLFPEDSLTVNLYIIVGMTFAVYSFLKEFVENTARWIDIRRDINRSNLLTFLQQFKINSEWMCPLPLSVFFGTSVVNYKKTAEYFSPTLFEIISDAGYFFGIIGVMGLGVLVNRYILSLFFSSNGITDAQLFRKLLIYAAALTQAIMLRNHYNERDESLDLFLGFLGGIGSVEFALVIMHKLGKFKFFASSFSLSLQEVVYSLNPLSNTLIWGATVGSGFPFFYCYLNRVLLRQRFCSVFCD